jgi:hypothetical protein
MKNHGGAELQLHSFSTLALEIGDNSASSPGCFIPRTEPSVAIEYKAGWSPDLAWKLGGKHTTPRPRTEDRFLISSSPQLLNYPHQIHKKHVNKWITSHSTKQNLFGGSSSWLVFRCAEEHRLCSRLQRLGRQGRFAAMAEKLPIIHGAETRPKTIPYVPPRVTPKTLHLTHPEFIDWPSK